MCYCCISEVKFKCDNGNNLYNEDEICNRVNDCGPNDDSDETRDCGKKSGLQIRVLIGKLFSLFLTQNI